MGLTFYRSLLINGVVQSRPSQGVGLDAGLTVVPSH